MAFITNFFRREIQLTWTKIGFILVYLLWFWRDLPGIWYTVYGQIMAASYKAPPKRNNSKNDLILRLDDGFNKIINKRCTVYVSYKHKYQCTISPTFVDAVWVTSALDRLHPSSIGSVGAVATATTLVKVQLWYIYIYIPETRCIQIWSWWYQEFGHI